MKKLLAALCLLTTSMPLHAGGDFPAPVYTDRAVEIEIAPTTWAPGTVVGRYDSRIAAEAEGRLLDVAEVGDRLDEGDVIATIDKRTYELEINEITAEMSPVEAEVRFYERESERLETLAKQNNAAKNRLDEIKMNRDQALGRIQVIKARLARARDDLAKATILAPFPGIVVERFKSPGERVESGDDVIRLVDTQQLEVQARVPAWGIFQFKTGDQLRIRDDELDFYSAIRTVVPVGDDVSRLYELRIECDQPGWTVGHAVEIAVPTGKPRKVIAVPRDAMVIRKDGIRVYRVNGEGKAEMLIVHPGIANETHIEIKSGINAGDEIVIRGNERLRPGQQVTVQSGSSNS